MKRKAITLGALRKAPVPPIGACLHCSWCAESFSADPRDYFMLDDSHKFKCGQCRKPLAYVRKVVTYQPIRLGKKRAA